MGEQGQPAVEEPRQPVCLPDGSIAYPAKADYKAIGTAQAAADFDAGLGGGWKFNADEMDVFLKKLNAEVDRVSKMSNRADVMNKVEPAGGDIASVQNAKVVNNSGALYKASIDSAVAYLTAYCDHCEQVRKAYLDRDDAAIATLRSIGKDA